MADSSVEPSKYLPANENNCGNVITDYSVSKDALDVRTVSRPGSW